MLSNDAVLNLVAYFPAFVSLYPAYWAFDIRHALTTRLYRNQAFGLGVFSLVVIIAVLPTPTPGSGGIIGTNGFLIGYFLVTSAFWLGTVNFVDATARVSRRLDPLLRDTFHWSKLRYLPWGVQIFNVAYTLVAVTVAILTKNSWLINQILQGNNNTVTSIYNLAPAFAWIVSFASLFMFVPIALRAKDRTLRRHLIWLAAFAGSVLAELVVFSALSLGTLSSSINSGVNLLLGNFVFFGIAAYLLYRSARSLVPINRISMGEISSKPQAPPPTVS